ncbi:MAG: hypothetical protein HOI86_02440 [Tateyamaria sp.]|jgi:hypothetical protein|nr:hypothetical protein [Tateyamaria sp.]MBT5303060.1 hypothetical protein [Tateyamaria sp.]MBT6266528.1 hypothetical protein [Tateyamaria sp.]MBT6341900.1 hypothetical protein [Tateyamaria sp.]MBT7446997.1 hypothetical protein [Tateyamaria sp.]
MKTPLKKLASLRILLFEMEQDLGINELGTIETAVLLSIADLENTDHNVTTKEILGHTLNSGCSRPSLFRALKSLEKNEKIKKVGDIRGYYRVVA